MSFLGRRLKPGQRKIPVTTISNLFINLDATYYQQLSISAGEFFRPIPGYAIDRLRPEVDRQEMRVIRIALSAACLAAALAGQTRINLESQSKNVNFQSAPYTKPAKAGILLPGTCTQGELFFLTAALPGANVYGCTAANAWTPQIRVPFGPEQWNNVGHQEHHELRTRLGRPEHAGGFRFAD